MTMGYAHSISCGLFEESRDIYLPSALVFSSIKEKKLSSERQLEAMSNTNSTLMTSKGCVAIVAIAPADAAEILCIIVEWPFDVGGRIMA
jgi:hypothetical protein